MKLDKLFKTIRWSGLSGRVINDLPDSILLIDKNYNLLKYNNNAKTLLNLSKNTLFTNINNIIPNLKDKLNEALQLNKPVLVKNTSAYLELNVAKTDYGYCASLRNITSLTNEIMNDDKIKHFNNEKNILISKIEDDLKAPINSITGFSKSLLDGLGGNLTEQQAKYVKIINNNALEELKFLDEIIQFSRVESSICEITSKPFDIIDELKLISEKYYNMASEHSINFSLNYDAILKRNISSDLESIKKIIQNLLDISFNMVEAGNQVYLNVSTPEVVNLVKYGFDEDVNRENFIRIHIGDTGVGIPEEEMKYLCEPYAQVEKGKKNLSRALKLATATILVKRLSGFIDFHSVVMQGTQYEIILPAEIKE